jgi:TolB-like protein
MIKKNKFLLSIFFGLASFIAIIASCATTIDFQVARPPTMNTLGIQRLAVMPFAATDNSSLQRQAALWLTNESLSRIQGTNHFTLVNSSEVERLRASRGNVESIADALFSGQVISISVKESTSQGTRKDKDGKTVTYTTYHREVQISYSYNLTRTRDGSLTGPVNKTFSTNSSGEKRADLQSAETMLQSLVKSGMSGLGRDVAPYMATERRSLMKEASSDKAVKQRAKDAEAQVKAGSYKIAQNAFTGIFQDTGSFAAGFNAALLIEVQGDLEGAAAFMQKVYDDTGNPQAVSEITRLHRAMDNAGLLEAYRTNQSQKDKVVANMVNTLPSILPEKPRVALINNSQNERDLAETIVNSIMEGFLSKKITVIDRNSRALVEMEKNYQYSGNVSDEEMVRIGHEAGVNTFILVSVTGAGASRRLSVRMLDVERNTILYQSPQTAEMNL